MQKQKRWRGVLFAIILGVMCLGLLIGGSLIIIQDINLEQAEITRIAFPGEDGELRAESVVLMEATELEEYVSKYRQYNSYIYYKALGDNEKLIYHAFEYALDNNCQHIWFDDRLLQDITYNVVDILRFLSLDSAMVEQNLARCTMGSVIQLSSCASIMQGEEITGCLVKVENFTATKMEKKEEAINKAKEIIAQMPERMTNTEKAQYFYDYLGKNVIYVPMGEREKVEIEFLYEALCIGETNCDGFANALSLLCSISGIPCFEKMYLPDDGTDGHTWNSMLLDGCWVNADATGAYKDVVTEDDPLMRFMRLNFGYSDTFQKNTPMYQELLPSCERDLIPIACHFQTAEDPGIIELVKEAYMATTQRYVVISFEEGPVEKPLFQQISNEIGFDIHYEVKRRADNRLYCYLFNNEGNVE